MSKCIHCQNSNSNSPCPYCNVKKEATLGKDSLRKVFEVGDGRLPKLKWLTSKKYTNKINLIKGRIAETIIHELFITMEYHVFRFGMEKTVPGIAGLLSKNSTEVAEEIRRMPDFIIHNPRRERVDYIEVKYRKDGRFSVKDLTSNYPYKHAFIILVSQTDIKCLSVEELYSGKEISPTCSNHLVNRKEFEMNKDIVFDYCQLTKTFFQHL